MLREKQREPEAEQEGVSGLRADVRHINRLRTAKKISEVIKNPDIQVGSLKSNLRK